MKIVIVLATLFSVACTTRLMAQPKKGEAALPIILRDVNGNTNSLSDLRGKVVLIDFWASWCAPCRKSNRELAPVYAGYKGKGFEIFGISLDKDTADWKKAIKDDKIQWVQTTESGGWDAPVALKWQIEQLPSSFLIDKNGVIVAINPSKKEIEAQLKKLL